MNGRCEALFVFIILSTLHRQFALSQVTQGMGQWTFVLN